MKHINPDFFLFRDCENSHGNTDRQKKGAGQKDAQVQGNDYDEDEELTGNDYLLLSNNIKYKKLEWILQNMLLNEKLVFILTLTALAAL